MNNVKVVNMSEREYRAYKRQRRLQNRMKKNVLRLTGTLLLVALIAICCKFASSKAAANNKIEAYKFYKTVNISYNETLYDIAEANFDGEFYDNIEEYLKEIKTINHISDNSAITGGQLIFIPYYDLPVLE